MSKFYSVDMGRMAVYMPAFSSELVSSVEDETESYLVIARKSKSTAFSDLLSSLRDKYVFDDFTTIERWMKAQPQLFLPLFEASVEIENLFGGRTKWLAISEDWEGTKEMTIEVEYGGSGEDASRLCRKFVENWLVSQTFEVRQQLVLGVRFV